MMAATAKSPVRFAGLWSFPFPAFTFASLLARTKSIILVLAIVFLLLVLACAWIQNASCERAANCGLFSRPECDPPPNDAEFELSKLRLFTGAREEICCESTFLAPTARRFNQGESRPQRTSLPVVDFGGERMICFIRSLPKLPAERRRVII